jgi:hypothetical protein
MAMLGGAWPGEAWLGKAMAVQNKMNTINPHPEWKRLIEAVLPLVESGKREFPYSELSSLGGVDVTTQRGRQQFLRFRKEASERFQIWFENVRCLGYRMVAAREHVESSSKRVVRSRRMVGQALRIVTNTKFDELSDAEKSAALSAQAAIGTLYLASKAAVKETRRMSGASEHPKLAAVVGAAMV